MSDCRHSAGIWLTCAVALVSACTEQTEPSSEPLAPLPWAEPTRPEHVQRATEYESRLLKGLNETGALPQEAPPSATPGEDIELPSDDLLGEIVDGPKDPSTQGDPVPEPHSIRADLTTPESLGAEVFRAMVTQDQPLFEHLLIDPQSLQSLAKIKEDAAVQRTDRLRKAALRRYQLFGSEKASESIETGLAERLVYVRTRIGKAATVWGKSPKRGEEVVQYWNNATVFRLARKDEIPGSIRATSEPDKGELGPYFEIELGRMLKTSEGQWKLATAPSIAGAFHVYLQAGLHLKPALLHPEHYQLPLSVGDFWRYRVLRTAGDTPDAVLDVSPEEIRLEVTEVKKHIGYRIVSMRRTHSTDKKTTTNQHLLITARRAYRCTHYCKYKGADLSYVLDYIRINTPILTFPARAGLAWRNGGHPPTATATARYTIRDTPETVSVPAGEFTDTLVVSGNRETRWFKPGVGVVRRQANTSQGARTQELIEYRVLTTE